MGWMLSGPRMKHSLLVGQSIVYLVAFASLYWQIPGLYGEEGIIPIAAKLENCDRSAPLSCDAPLLFMLTDALGCRPSSALQLLCLIGMVTSLMTMAFSFARHCLVYVSLVLIYLSAFQAGGTFLWFQWDTLILESGWIMALLASFCDSPSDYISTYLVRFLAARLMFASGIVKLQSMCPTWWGLTEMIGRIRRVSVAVTFLIEIYLPPMFLLPLAPLRWVAAVPQIVFMIAIMATGNYNFFNFHFALLAFSCLDGSRLYDKKSMMRAASEWILSIAIFGLAVAHWMKAFGIGFDAKTLTVVANIQFSKAEFAEWTRIGTSVVVHLGILGFVLANFTAFLLIYKGKEVINKSGKSRSTKNKNKKEEKRTEQESGRTSYGTIVWLNFFLVLGAAHFLFWTSFVPFTTIDAAASDRVPFVIRSLHKSTDAFQFSHSYGLFRRMTGVEGRPEIVLEGSDEPAGPWTEIQFYAKPGKLNRSPSFVLPHQPRLDWQMWFAALGAYQHNPWFLSLTNRLLNNDSNVIRLLASEFPFNKKKPLKFLRAQLYFYRYTKPGQTNWWTRTLQSEYMPVQTKNTPALLEYLKTNGLLSTKKYVAGPLDETLSSLHHQATRMEQAPFVWSVLVSALLIILLNKIVR